MHAVQMPGFEGRCFKLGIPRAMHATRLMQSANSDGSQSDQPGCDIPEQQHTLHPALSTTRRAGTAAS